MGWIERAHSKGQIDRAGRSLVTLPKDDPARLEAITIVDNWRVCHSYPLQIIKMTLFNRARTIDPHALIAQRLKRRPSIEIKLRDNPHMKLSQMQDIGGCRAILKTVGNVKKLLAKYKAYHAKSPKDRSAWDGSDEFDYIQNPKPDGYRSVHLIFRFQSAMPKRAVFNGQRVEIQIRSKLQHVWATAVETAQVFTGQALKSKIKNASEDWLRFFVLTSAAFSMRERTPNVPGAPNDRNDLVRELREIVQRLDVMQSLRGWNDTIHLLEDAVLPGAYQFLLELDPNKHTLRVQQFAQNSAGFAQERYEKAEKDTENDPTMQVVLVSVESVDRLHEAYPNYYVDTKDFIAAVEKELK
jgi:ppGpp synthetase/RelA/SpoT-type nucleotidyltranferase